MPLLLASLFAGLLPTLTSSARVKLHGASRNDEFAKPVAGTYLADELLCGGADECDDVCTGAITKFDQPLFPLDFFGGYNAKQREKVKDKRQNPPNGVGEAELDLEYDDGALKVQDVDDNFVYPMSMPAYFTCYTRGKWPLFNAWVVDPELQVGGSARHGSFGIPKKHTDSYQKYHGTVPDEYLRSSDVSGVWSEYYGFDQGHWAPDAPFRHDKALVASTYFYVNVSPQSSCLNRGNWEKLEAAIRETSVETDSKIAVMAGPLESLPETFYDTPEEKKEWHDLLAMWRDASQVMLSESDESSGDKDPHWISATSTSSDGKHCVMRGSDSLKEGLEDIEDQRICDAERISRNLKDYNLFLMTEAGTRKTRRGVRVPLGYWKVASWEDPSAEGNLYCCWMFDQTNAVQTSESCLSTVSQSGGVVFPPDMEYAGTQLCEEYFNQMTTKAMECHFADRGIGWRGKYLLGDVEQAEQERNAPKCEGRSKGPRGKSCLENSGRGCCLDEGIKETCEWVSGEGCKERT